MIPAVAEIVKREEKAQPKVETKQPSSGNPFSSPAVAGMAAAATVSAGAAAFFLWKAKMLG